MSSTLSRGLCTAVSLLLMLLALPALAQTDGLGALREEVAKARQQTPEAFTRLEAAVAQVDVLDARKRGTVAAIAPLFRQLGPQGLWPMVERLAFDTGQAPQPERDSAKLALQLGMIEATGELRDARLLPLWTYLLERLETRRPARRAAATALAKLESDEAAQVLVALSREAGARGLSVLGAMGSCRRLTVAQRLAEVLAARPAPEVARRVAQALGDIGSAWAWKTPQVKHRAEEGAVRRVAAEALVHAWPDYSGDAQRALTQAVLRVDAPETLTLLQSTRARMPDAQRAGLGTLERQVVNNPLR
ncbi:hypothetical protein LXT21_12865 [Myxococcus sp. K38C18041901]|uniref:hypothetical protein n=1 Tax=Myxococcus guangdongensis TaxID=2906760 RepID=UPI0020A7AA4D|nr:hypothetical protein [Myxococcus guangdongensis]MCP3059671.1 hypothetical protein [Myxococcus guangdongensis]